jgi:hypothetical protein
MKVLLKEGADTPTPATILVPSSRGEAAFETLIGETLPSIGKGVIAEFDEPAVIAAVNEAAAERDDEFVTAKDLARHLRHLNKGFGDYEIGSKIGLQETDGRVLFDDSGARRVNRAEGLAKGDLIAVGPSVRPKAYMNARGTIDSIGGGTVEIILDAGDRDRIERDRGKRVAERLTMPVGCAEKLTPVAAAGQN